VLEACDVERRDERACVLDVQGRLGRYAVLGEEFINGGAQELAIDEDVKRYRLVVWAEQTVYEGRELWALESWRKLAYEESRGWRLCNGYAQPRY
jgi:hypothetical protein